MNYHPILRFLRHPLSIAVIILWSASSIYPQAHLVVGVGLIRNFQEASNQPRYAFYPEMQISEDLGDSQTITVRGGIYLGYWDDRVDKGSNCADCYTHSFSSLVAGLRLEALFKEFPLPISAFAGLARHFVAADYLGGGDIAGNAGENFTDRLNTVELGIRIHIPLHDRFTLRGNYQRYYPIDKQNHGYDATARRPALGIGLAYTF